MRVVRWLASLLFLGASATCDEPAAEDEIQRAAEACCADATARLEAYLGKKFKAAVPVEMKTKEEMAAFALEQAKQEMPADLTEAAQKVAERLHLVPPGYDILEKQIEILKKSVMGLYDPEADRFYVVRGMAEPGSEEFAVTVAHELVHAYRDVDKDYNARATRLLRTNGDEMQALRFLVEGDATLLGYAVGFAILSKAADPDVDAIAQLPWPATAVDEALADPELAAFPLVLKEPLIAPYIEGHAFACAIFRAGGKEALDKAFDRPPRSTEQVLHPAKYLGEPDEPIEFEGGDPTAALGDGWRCVCTDVIGELDVRVLFAEKLGRPRARAAAEGWDGARYWLCEKDGAPSFVGAVTVWDSESEAREFARAWADWAVLRDGAEGAVGGSGAERRVETREGLVVVRREGADVLIADGVPRDREILVLRAMATARRVERKAE